MQSSNSTCQSVMRSHIDILQAISSLLIVMSINTCNRRPFPSKDSRHSRFLQCSLYAPDAPIVRARGVLAHAQSGQATPSIHVSMRIIKGVIGLEPVLWTCSISGPICSTLLEVGVAFLLRVFDMFFFCSFLFGGKLIHRSPNECFNWKMEMTLKILE